MWAHGEWRLHLGLLRCWRPCWRRTAAVAVVALGLGLLMVDKALAVAAVGAAAVAVVTLVVGRLGLLLLGGAVIDAQLLGPLLQRWLQGGAGCGATATPAATAAGPWRQRLGLLLVAVVDAALVLMLLGLQWRLLETLCGTIAAPVYDAAGALQLRLRLLVEAGVALLLGPLGLQRWLLGA